MSILWTSSLRQINWICPFFSLLATLSPHRFFGGFSLWALNCSLRSGDNGSAFINRAVLQSVFFLPLYHIFHFYPSGLNISYVASFFGSVLQMLPLFSHLASYNQYWSGNIPSCNLYFLLSPPSPCSTFFSSLSPFVFLRT